jgi:hypothetical protein
MRSIFSSKIFHGVILALALSAMLPAAAVGQRRWGAGRQNRARIVVHNYQQPYVIYQRRPVYGYRSYSNGYPQTYYGSQYAYRATQPYYTDQYYSYRYSQPYFANRYTYAWANPTYRYNGYRYRQSYRRNGLRLRIRLR